jgi:hypothetical protein
MPDLDCQYVSEDMTPSAERQPDDAKVIATAKHVHPFPARMAPKLALDKIKGLMKRGATRLDLRVPKTQTRPVESMKGGVGGGGRSLARSVG